MQTLFFTLLAFVAIIVLMSVGFIFKKQAKASYSEIESWKPNKIVFSHGKIILENGTEKLKEAFYWLRK